MGSPASWRWSGDEISGGDAVVFDIDGVLANADERQHFIAGGNRDWHSFFAACGQDTVIEETFRLLSLVDDQKTVILLTGRPIETQELTVEWLNKYKLRWDLLIMREHGTYDSSLIFKQQSVRRLKLEGFSLKLAFEDDLRNREMFQNEDVPCMYVHSGYYAERDAADEAARQQKTKLAKADAKKASKAHAESVDEVKAAKTRHLKAAAAAGDDPIRKRA